MAPNQSKGGLLEIEQTLSSSSTSALSNLPSSTTVLSNSSSSVSSGSYSTSAAVGNQTPQSKSLQPEKSRVYVPSNFFRRLGPTPTPGNSYYHCATCQKKLSAGDTSRANLRKHIEVSTYRANKINSVAYTKFQLSQNIFPFQR